LAIFRYSKKTGIDWQKLGGVVIVDDEVLQLIQNLQSSYLTDLERIRAFRETTGYSRATYYRYKAQLVG